MGHCNKMERHPTSAIFSCLWSHFLTQSVKPKVKQQYLASLSRVASATPCWVWSLCKSVSKLDSGVCYVKCRLFEALGYLIPLWPLWWFNSSQVLCRKWTTMLINNRYRAKTSDSHDAFFWVSGDLHKNQEASTIKLYQSASSWDFKASSRQVSWIIAFSPLVKMPDLPRSKNARLLLWSLGGGLWGPGEKEQFLNDGVARRFHGVSGPSVPGLVRTHRVAPANSRSGFPSGSKTKTSEVGTVFAAFAQGFNVSVTKRNSWRRCLGLPVFTSWDAQKKVCHESCLLWCWWWVFFRGLTFASRRCMAFALIHRWQKFHMTPRYGPKMCRQTWMFMMFWFRLSQVAVDGVSNLPEGSVVQLLILISFKTIQDGYFSQCK